MNEAVRLLFHELSGLPSDRRAHILTERQIEPHVRAEVESLLAHDSAESQSFTACIAEAAGEMLSSLAGGQAHHCGPYRFVRLLGSGGMGDVYLAEREGEIQQRVAIKVLGDGRRAGWKERFLRERQLLASLHHASIVHVIDAGHTDDGRPFLAMEYVEGVPINVYASRIGVRERLTLFLQVCDAVSHAHRHLIIHRDLKPSNILVDESGRPKLLDFGIAKLLDDARDRTQTSERLLTPNYASPEQLSGGVQTTATDIYSLGAVLYKLLTGESPNEYNAHAGKAAGAEVVRPSRLNPDVPADLDYVLQKALRTEPEERYKSVEALAADIRAVLESRPVEARAGDTWYRARKFLRRYSLPLGAVAMVIASLSAGLLIANHERVLAEQRFGQLRQLSNRVFDLDKAIRDLPGSTKARQRLVAASLGYLQGLAADSRGNVELARELGEGYWRVGRIQGVPTEFNLGERAEAEANLKKASDLLDGVLATFPRDRRALLDTARIAQDRMILAEEEHRDAEAQAHARKAAARLDAFLSQGNTSDAERNEAAATYGNIALAYINMHLYGDAIPFARRTVEIARTLRSPGVRLSQGLSLLANSFRYQGELEKALQTIREARRVANQAKFGDGTERMFNLYGVLLREGMILGEDGGINLNRPAEAAAVLQQAFDMAEEAARKDPNDAVSRSRVATSGDLLANILRHSDPQRALAVYDLSLRRLGEIQNSVYVRRDRAKLLADSSYALRSLHRISEAKQRVDEAMTILKDTKDFPAEEIRLDSVAYVALCALADQAAETGDRHRAIRLYEAALRKVSAPPTLDAFSDFRDAPRLSRLYEALGRLYLWNGERDKSDMMQARRLELWRHWDSKLPNNSFVGGELVAAVRDASSSGNAGAAR